jgi:SRSO17 transposase
MTTEELAQWAESLEAFPARFAPRFQRRETREQAAKYLRGLLAPLERQNGWQLAEALGDATRDRTQRLLYRAGWDAEAARDVLQQFVIETFGDPEGIGVVDETGFLKKGTARRARPRWGCSGSTAAPRGRWRTARWPRC